MLLFLSLRAFVSLLLLLLCPSVDAIVTFSVSYYAATLTAPCRQFAPVAQAQPHRAVPHSDHGRILKRVKRAVSGDELSQHPEEEEEELWVVQLFGPTEEEVERAIEEECGGQITKEWGLTSQGSALLNSTDVLFRSVVSGPSANRIDIVFMGDGYTDTQYELFVEDMQRLVDDMFGAKTFASYLPILNIWFLFRASNEEGIGVGGVPKDTAFGLYRSGTELRGIFTSKAQVCHCNK